MARPSVKAELLHGTLDLLILQVISQGAMHGYGISQRLAQISSDALQVTQGSLYPALHRLERRGWLRGQWGTAPSGREAKFYALTAKGRKQLETERTEWRRFADLIALAITTAE